MTSSAVSSKPVSSAICAPPPARNSGTTLTMLTGGPLGTAGASGAALAVLREPLAQHGVTGGCDFVEPPHRHRERRLAQHLRIGHSLSGHGAQRLDQAIEVLARLGLGGFDHERLVDDQREVRRRWAVSYTHL